MMDPVEPWIDVASVRRMAAQLLSEPVGTEVEDRPDAGFGPSFEGFLLEGKASTADVPAKGFFNKVAASNAEDPEEGRVPAEKKEAESREGERGGRIVSPPKPPPLPEAAEKGSGRGPLVERMRQFRKWMAGHAAARGVFVLDRDGLPVLDDPEFAKLHFLARSLSQAYRPVAGQAGNVHVKVGSSAFLVVIPVETVFGCLVLGAVLPEPLDAAQVEVVSRALADAARPERL